MCVEGAVGLGAWPSIYFGKEKTVLGEQSTPCVLPHLHWPLCVPAQGGSLVGPSALASLKISQAQQMALCWLQVPPVL